MMYVWIITRTAWVGDDAYITFRSIENVIHGYGPTFNIGERVQTFTHPLWFVVQALANFMLGSWKDNPLGSGQLYFLNIILSIVFSTFAVLIFSFSIASNVKSATVGILVLSLSKAFVDYSTSGLENPLTHLIVISFLAIYWSYERNNPTRLFALAFLTALAGMNRLDLPLLFLPVLLYLFLNSASKRTVIKAFALGLLPLLFWETFAIFYYGTPFPNTAFAKINTGIATIDMLKQGVYYYFNSFRMDPISLLTILISIIIGFHQKIRPKILIVMGVILYLCYILYIGGDFMGGRYFSTLVLIAVAILGKIEFKSLSIYGLAIGLALIVGIFPIFLIPERSLSFGQNTKNLKIFVDDYGISDERRFYFAQMGFLNSLARGGAPRAKYSREKWIYHPNRPLQVELVGTLGVTSYNLGPDVHVIDRNALADPLMGRMPLQDPNHWRIGHFRHIIPEGYIKTLASGKNQIIDHNIALYYDKLSYVIKGDLWSWDRIIEIWNLNTGKYDYLIQNVKGGN